MKIQILGSGCPTCKNLHANVQAVVTELGLNVEIEYSTDIAEIVKLGVMSSPVFVIDGRVITAGKVPSNDELRVMILEGCASKKSVGTCSCGGKC